MRDVLWGAMGGMGPLCVGSIRRWATRLFFAVWALASRLLKGGAVRGMMAAKASCLPGRGTGTRSETEWRPTVL